MQPGTNATFDGIDSNCMTLTRWILHNQRKYKNATGELTSILQSIQTACKIISMAVRKAGINKIFGLSGVINSTGDSQQKLDVLANELFVNLLSSTNKCCMLISEENEEPIMLNTESGNYLVAFDPLDGSSNIDCLASIGSIFGVWRRPHDCCDSTSGLQSGRKLQAAGYILYGSATLFVLAVKDSVCGFTLDPNIGEFVLTHQDMRIPKKGSIYSLNEGGTSGFDEHLLKYLNELKYPENPKDAYKARYIGSMVSDVHRTLVYGGIFIYPGSKDNKDGKLRILYECMPISFIVENAGGMSVTPHQNVLDLVPQSIHAKCPVYLGSPDDVKHVMRCYNL